MSDPAKYRTKEEVASWKERDPLHNCEMQLRGEYGVNDEALESLDDEVVEEMAGAVEFAEESPFPDPDFRFRHHYVEDDPA
jgi:pyruvate dehydrogenase E1 component alpha subunit